VFITEWLKPSDGDRAESGASRGSVPNGYSDGPNLASAPSCSRFSRAMEFVWAVLQRGALYPDHKCGVRRRSCPPSVVTECRATDRPLFTAICRPTVGIAACEERKTISYGRQVQYNVDVVLSPVPASLMTRETSLPSFNIGTSSRPTDRSWGTSCDCDS
jgi:hypothetical protein